MNSKAWILAGILVALPALSGFAQDAGRSDSRPTPLIRVTGSAEVGAEPDMATFEIGANITDDSASKAMAQAGQISDRIVDSLQKMGVPRDKIQTTTLQLNRQLQNIPGPDGRPSGKDKETFMAVHNVQVEVGKDRFNQIGDLLDAGMKAGANFVGNISFGIHDDSSLQDQGLEKAVKDARRKADVMAKAAGLTITGISTLQENNFGRPIPYADAGIRTMALSAPSPVPPSEIKRTYSVVVEYTFR